MGGVSNIFLRKSSNAKSIFKMILIFVQKILTVQKCYLKSGGATYKINALGNLCIA